MGQKLLKEIREHIRSCTWINAHLFFVLVIGFITGILFTTHTASSRTTTFNRLKQQSTDQTVCTNKYLALLENAITGTLYNDVVLKSIQNISQKDFRIDEKRYRGNDWPGEAGHTMVGHLRLRNIRDLLLNIISNGIQGDFAEFGVWRGGSCIYASGLFDIMGIGDRHVHVFDAFGKLDSETGGYGSSNDYLAVSELQVRFNFWKYGLLSEDRVKFYQGLFQDTAPIFRKALEHSKRKLSVLRIDGNFYDSYMAVLDNLFDLVSEDGYVIFDDIRSHPDVQKAWNDFQKSREVEIPLTFIDDHSAFFKKTSNSQR